MPQVREWPFFFYSSNLHLEGIPLEFGCTILEGAAQRKELILFRVLDILKGHNQCKLEQELEANKLPEIFNLHITANTITDAKISISLSKKYLSNILVLMDGPIKDLDVKKTFLEKVKSIETIRDVCLVEGGLPQEFSIGTTQICHIMDGNSGFRVALSLVL